MSAATLAEEFHPIAYDLDDRFVKNTGGDGTNMLSRAIYELITPVGEDDPSLTLEMYVKYNDDISTQRELHGNLVLRAKLEDLDTLNMGFLFNSEPEAGNWDGLLVSADYSARSDYSVVYTG